MKFQVFKNGKIAKDFALSATYMFGADTAPLRTSNKIRFKNGSIECSKKGPDSAGLALLWPVDGFGRTLLSTTRLPERKRPYNLNVELARARLMQITLKREDWSLFEEETNSFAGLAHQAQELFIEALQNIADPPKASVLADESLKKALVFSEKLATRHAELFVAAKCKNKALGRHSLGCRIDPHLIGGWLYVPVRCFTFPLIICPIGWTKVKGNLKKFAKPLMSSFPELLRDTRDTFMPGV